MDILIYWTYGIFSSLFPFLLATIYFKKRYKSNHLIWPKAKTFTLILFALYIIMVLYVTGSGTIYDFIRNDFVLQTSRTNLRIFDQGVFILTNILNLCMFIPFGFFLPMIWQRHKKISSIFLASFFFSLLIESSQLLNVRSFDIDDLLFNCLGGLIGYSIYGLFTFVRGRSLEKAYLPLEMPVLLLILFLGKFFLFNGMALARALYNF